MKKILLLAMTLGFSTPAFAYHIWGTVFCDSNLNGVMDPGETGQAGVTVQVSRGTDVFQDVTDASGQYRVDIQAGLGGSLEDSVGIWAVTIIDGLNGGASVLAPAGGSWQIELTPFGEPDAILFVEDADFAINDPVCRDPEPFCGDGNVDLNEMCDDGNNMDGDGCSAMCTIEAMCGDGNLDPGEQCDDGNDLNGDGCSAMCTVEGGGEGCTPGYWKQPHHFDSYPAAYGPNTLFSDVFADAFPGMTLVQVASQGGGKLKALGRHTVAALLNAASSDVGYDRTTDQVIDSFNSAYASGSYKFMKNVFENFNEQGCPLN